MTHSVDTAEGILRLGHRFREAKLLLAAVRLDVFSALHEAPASHEEVGSRVGLSGRGLPDFLRALAVLGLVEEDGGRYRNAPGATRHLVRGAPEYIGGFLAGADASLYPAYGRLAQALRTGRPQADGEFTAMLDDPAALAAFARMMDGLTETLGPELVRGYDWSGHRRVLDVGGCRGNLVARLVEAHPHLTGQVFDLPQLEPLFADYTAARGLAGRVSFQAGDFFADPLPGADAIVYGHILHDWSPVQRAHLVALAYAALEPGGTLLVYDRMLNAARDNTTNLVASLTMLLMTDEGSEYTVTEVEHLARAAGFAEVSFQPLGEYETLAVCHKR